MGKYMSCVNQPVNSLFHIKAFLSLTGSSHPQCLDPDLKLDILKQDPINGEVMSHVGQGLS